jgi:S-DNA-T family DNA segregation ATPase FtsK/SpoIIIE
LQRTAADSGNFRKLLKTAAGGAPFEEDDASGMPEERSVTVQLLLTVSTANVPARDVWVSLEPQTSIAELAAEIARMLGVPGLGTAGLWRDGSQIPPRETVESAHLLQGSRLALGWSPNQHQSSAQDVALELHVVGGPDSGRVHALPFGDWVIGRREPAHLIVRDDCASRRHACLHVSPTGLAVTDLGSSNGTSVEGVPATGSVPISLGQVISVGDSLLIVRPRSAPDAVTRPGGAGFLEFNRPPRLLPPPLEVRIALPDPPAEQHKRPIPVIAVCVPLVFGVVLAAVLGSPTYLLFGLMSPLLAIGNAASDRRGGKQTYRQQRERYEADLVAARARIEDARAAEEVQRRAAFPDPAWIAQIVKGPRGQLWERRAADEDALVVRVGLGELPARVQWVRRGQADGDQEHQPRVFDVPVTVGLREAGVLGLAGPPDAARAGARWLVAQLAALHTPRDLTLVLLTAAGGGGRGWNWFRWLPHARPDDTGHCLALVGNDEDTVGARVGELSALVKARTAALRESGRAADFTRTAATVVVLDGAHRLRSTPGLAQILADGPGVGVFAICVDAERRLLPEECLATVEWQGSDPTAVTVHRTRDASVERVLADSVSARWCDELARAMAPLRDVSAEAGERRLPASARLLDVLRMADPSATDLEARWVLHGSTTEAPIGVGLDGLLSLDLRRDGPHGLIAGTTGSGKSELLQTVVASLAVANRPDAMTFVLVDYKGGSAFKDCVRLPHTVGMVTDLDAHLVERALTSLTAELRRREHILAAAKVKDLDDYDALRASNGPALGPLPRLLLVIDEFASLARDLPDFVTGLVNIAQRGRSLGIHLLLATQRPSGVVSPEIRANTNLRIALRVTDDADSTDVLGSPEAGRISPSTPGRGLVRLAHGSLEPFQAARVGGRRESPGIQVRSAPVAVPIDWLRLGWPAPSVAEPTNEAEVTDLSVLVEAVRGASINLGVPPQPSPWLPALPEELLLDAVGRAPDAGGIQIAYGTADLPDEQSQRPALFDLARDGHLLAVGSARSGRSQLLRTLAGSVARSVSSADVHLYGIDCGNGALAALAELPHCGAVVGRAQTERAVRLLTRLTAELERRQGLLAEQGFGNIGEQRAASPPDGRLPHLVVLVDRWEGFTSSLGELDGGRLTDTVLGLLREGGSVGIHLVITGDRSLASARMTATTEHKLAFRLSDRSDVALLGLNPRHLPDQVPPGRAFAAETGREIQVALLSPAASGPGQAVALTQIGRDAQRRDGEVPRALRPFRVDVLPGRLSFDQAWQLRDLATGPLFGLVGVGGDDLAALGPDLATGLPSFVVAGPSGSGRSTVLAAMARSLLAGGAVLLVAAPRPSPLRALAGLPGVAAVWTDGDLPEAELSRQLDEAGTRPLVLIIDDAELLKDCSAKELLRGLVKGRGEGPRAVLVGGSADDLNSGFSGWHVEAKKARRGALLSPQDPSHGELIGVRLPRTSTGEPTRPGRALLNLGDGRLVTVQVPVMDG